MGLLEESRQGCSAQASIQHESTERKSMNKIVFIASAVLLLGAAVGCNNNYKHDDREVNRDEHEVNRDMHRVHEIEKGF